MAARGPPLLLSKPYSSSVSSRIKRIPAVPVTGRENTIDRAERLTEFQAKLGIDKIQGVHLADKAFINLIISHFCCLVYATKKCYTLAEKHLIRVFIRLIFVMQAESFFVSIQRINKHFDSIKLRFRHLFNFSNHPLFGRRKTRSIRP